MSGRQEFQPKKFGQRFGLQAGGTLTVSLLIEDNERINFVEADAIVDAVRKTLYTKLDAQALPV